MADENKVKTAQPFSEDDADQTSPNVTGGAPKPRPDATDDPRKQNESAKTTQRQE